MEKAVPTFSLFEDNVIDISAAQTIKRKKKMTKKSRLELYPIKRVQYYANGAVVESYWVVIKPNGIEIQCKNYEDAYKIQQETLDKKEKQ